MELCNTVVQGSSELLVQTMRVDALFKNKEKMPYKHMPENPLYTSVRLWACYENVINSEKHIINVCCVLLLFLSVHPFKYFQAMLNDFEGFHDTSMKFFFIRNVCRRKISCFRGSTCRPWNWSSTSCPFVMLFFARVWRRIRLKIYWCLSCIHHIFTSSCCRVTW